MPGQAARTIAVAAAALATYIGGGAVLLNNASAAAFPRELIVLSLALATAFLVAALAWREARLLSGALFGLAVALFLGHPALQDMRLRLLWNALPLSAEQSPTSSPARCLCTTRASLLELFGPPDFIGQGVRGTARVYAYLSADGERVLLYEMRGQSGSEDRVDRIRDERTAPETLGLIRW